MTVAVIFIFNPSRYLAGRRHPARQGQGPALSRAQPPLTRSTEVRHAFLLFAWLHSPSLFPARPRSSHPLAAANVTSQTTLPRLTRANGLQKSPLGGASVAPTTCVANREIRPLDEKSVSVRFLLQ